MFKKVLKPSESSKRYHNQTIKVDIRVMGANRDLTDTFTTVAVVSYVK